MVLSSSCERRFMNDTPAEVEPLHSAASSDAGSRSFSLRIRTGSRLHFGLIDTAAPFGGVGVMVEQPATEVVVCPDSEFRCDDPSASRVRQIAGRVARQAGLANLPACRVEIAARPPAHHGLGSGTQLAMATAEALCRFVGHDVDATELACHIAGRGERSAVGIHGYFQGGLIYESSENKGELNSICERVELPGWWCVAIFRPRRSIPLVAGDTERAHFSQLPAADRQQRRKLQQILSDQLLPAAASGDFDRFAESVGRFNHSSGLLFESIQGGPYNGSAVSSLVQTLLDRGATGVGQSSWGPGVFTWFRSPDDAKDFLQQLPPELADITLATPKNQGRTLTPC